MQQAELDNPSEHDYHFPAPFLLESGAAVAGLHLRYSVWGRPAADGGNVVWVCHALTGSHRADAWWPGLVGKGRYYDPASWCIVCVNVPGSCYGSTGPLSIPAGKLSPYFEHFPAWSARDVVRAFDHLADVLQLPTVHTVIGGSMGGQHALEWAIINPKRMQHLVLLASNAEHSAWGRAFDASQRAAILLDPTWPSRHPRAGIKGMKTARQLAVISYRTHTIYQQRASTLPQAEAYQVYQGDKLARRFNAWTYWHMSLLLDSHDVGRGRGGVTAALTAVKARTLVVSIRQDVLFPPVEQALMATHIPNAELITLDSDYGHDGFLTETETIGQHLAQFYQQQTTLQTTNTL